MLLGYTSVLAYDSFYGVGRGERVLEYSDQVYYSAAKITDTSKYLVETKDRITNETISCIVLGPDVLPETQ